MQYKVPTMEYKVAANPPQKPSSQPQQPPPQPQPTTMQPSSTPVGSLMQPKPLRTVPLPFSQEQGWAAQPPQPQQQEEMAAPVAGIPTAPIRDAPQTVTPE